MPYNTDEIIKIAIAEDHTMFREELCRRMNEWENCKVILEAENGLQFLNKLNPKNLPHVALVDLRMPVMNGYQTMEMLQKKFPEIKCMVLSEIEENEEAMMLVLKAGGKGFLNKSADIGLIKRAIHELIQMGYYFSNKSVARMAKQLIETGMVELKNILSDKELMFLQNLSTEKTYKQIADDMNISVRKVEYLRVKMFERFTIKSRTALAIQSKEKGLVL